MIENVGKLWYKDKIVFYRFHKENITMYNLIDTIMYMFYILYLHLFYFIDMKCPINQDRGRHCLGWLYPGRLPGQERKKCKASFARERLVIVGFWVTLITLQRFSSDHASSKSPFDQSPPHPLGFTVGEWPPAGPVRETGPQKRRALEMHFSTSTILIIDYFNRGQSSR